MGRGWSLYDWREENSEWVHKWENEALADIVYQLRYILFTLFYYDDHTMREYALLSSQRLMLLYNFADRTMEVQLKRTSSGTASARVQA